MSTATDLLAYVEHFRARVLQDALNEATAAYWTRRAEQLESAMPRAGDHFGKCTPEQLATQVMRLAEQAQACRNRAAVSLIGGPLA